MTSRGREKRRESEIEIGSRRRRLCDKSERPPYLHFRTGSRPLISDAPCDDVRGKPGCRPKRAPLRRYEVSVLPSHLPPHPHSQPTLPSPHSRADRVPCQQHPTPDLTGGEGSSGAPGFDPPPERGGVVWCRFRRHPRRHASPGPCLPRCDGLGLGLPSHGARQPLLTDP